MLIILFFSNALKVWVLLYVVVCMVDKKDLVVYMVWSVGLELRGGEFKPWLKQKRVEVLAFFFCSFMEWRNCEIHLWVTFWCKGC